MQRFAKTTWGRILDYITVAAVAVFIVTLFLMIKRPFGLRLGYAAGIGAVASLVLWVNSPVQDSD